MKKITAIVLCVLLAMSALVVLAACGTKEYVVSFREQTSKIIYQGKTINGKAVEPKAPAKEGYEFKGWYKTLTGSVDDSGNTVYTFSDPMDFDKAVDGDLDLYAKYEVSTKSVASANSFYIVGNFDGDFWNGTGVADLNRMLQPDDEGKLTATITVGAKQQFKVKQTLAGWNSAILTVIDAGGGNVKSVTLADGVTLPGELTTDTLLKSGDNIEFNAALATAGKELKIKLTFIETSKDISIEVLEVNDCDHNFVSGACTKCGAADPEAGGPVPCATGYRLVGQVGTTALWSSNDGKYKMTADAQNANLFRISITLATGDQIKIKENLFNPDGTPDWTGNSYGHGAIDEVELDDGVALPSGIATNAALFTTNNDGNICAAAGCTITITLDFSAGTLSILVTEIAE